MVQTVYTLNSLTLLYFKVAIKILQGSAVTQTVLSGLTIYLLVANFL